MRIDLPPQIIKYKAYYILKQCSTGIRYSLLRQNKPGATWNLYKHPKELRNTALFRAGDVAQVVDLARHV
jgi:hypothetical protein